MTPFLDETRKDEHKAANAAQTMALLGGIAVILVFIAWLISGWFGIVIAVIAIGVFGASAPRISPQFVMRLYRAKPLDSRHGGQLNRIVEVLADRAELPAHPKLYIIPSTVLNAFATGSPERSAIALTEGLMRKLSMRELAAVLAHEMSHIRNEDLAVHALADAMSRMTQLLSYFGLTLAAFNFIGFFSGEPPFSWLAILLLYLAPAAGSLLQLALSRTREFDADLEAANLTGDPAALADALVKLEQFQGRFWEDLSLPVPGRKIPYPSLLRSHPTTEDRLARLKDIDKRNHLPPITTVEEPMISLVGMGPGQMRPRYRWPVGFWF